MHVLVDPYVYCSGDHEPLVCSERPAGRGSLVERADLSCKLVWTASRLQSPRLQWELPKNLRRNLHCFSAGTKSDD